MRPFASLLGLLLFVSTGLAHAGVVGMDARSLSLSGGWNPPIDARYASFRAVFTDAAHTLQSLSSFTATDLAGIDLLVLFQPTDSSLAFTSAEAAAIHAFVAGGGALFAIPEGGWGSNSTLFTFNAVIAPYGITALSPVSNPSGVLVNNLAPHELTDGVTSIGLDYHRVLSITAPAVDLTNGTLEVLAATDSQNGSGRVAVITDHTCFNDPGFGADYDLFDLHNKKLLENIIDWLLVPFGDGCPGAGGFVPKLTATSYTPSAGTQIGLQLTQALGGSNATFFFGLGQAEIPMAGGCTLNIWPLFPASFVVPLSGAGPGEGAVFLAGILPSDMGGVTFSMQAFIQDPTFAHGFSNTNEIVIAVQ